MAIPALLAPLLAQGLNLIGNAVMAKGKEWVEEKTGVVLQPNLSDKDILTLRQYEMDHEEELLRLRIEENKLDIETFKEEVKDRGSARERDAEFVKAGRTNTRANIMVFMDALGLVACLAVLAVYRQELPGEAVALISTVASIFGLCLRDAHQFEFGSSRGSQDKTEMLLTRSIK